MTRILIAEDEERIVSFLEKGLRASGYTTLAVGDASYEIYRLDAVEGQETLPYSLKILLENLLRTEDGVSTTAEHVRALAAWDPQAEPDTEIQYTPARVLMQDFTGVPCVVDLAAMREAMAELGGDPRRINPLAPAELVIDHSVVADFFGTKEALGLNSALEYDRNKERYEFLKWGQKSFTDFAVVPRTPASSTRSTSSGWPASCSSATARPTPTPSSAPTPTPR